MSILKLNSEGVEVANWQRFLNSQGYKIEADGDFGQATEHATQQFQLKQGLIADGEVGVNTYAMAEKVKGNVNLGSQKPQITPTSSNVLPILQKLAKVHPNLADKAAQIIIMASVEGFQLTISQGLRTFEEQNALFAKRPKVTNARGGQSMHNFGLAVDFMFKVNGVVSWDEKLYKNIGRWANQVGLEWGGSWAHFTDLPHCQLKGLPSYKVLLPIYNQGGLKAVWEKYKG